MSMPDETTMRHLLLMAAAVHNFGPNIDADPPRANVYKVIRQALHWAGLFNERVHFTLQSYEECAEITAFYDTLISMMAQGKAAEPLFDGAGNFLGDSRASPFFTHCRLTQRGLETATELLNAHPRYRNDRWETS